MAGYRNCIPKLHTETAHGNLTPKLHTETGQAASGVTRSLFVRLPELIVFDLDFTLWDCGGTWCDCLSPPFRSRAGQISDRTGRIVRLYEDVRSIIDSCRSSSVPIALASRTEQPEWARELVDLLEITDCFAFAEIYPSSKLRHFASLRKASGVPYDQMLFFDDEMRNITEVSSLGVTSIHVADGLTDRLFQVGWHQFASR